MKSSLLYLVLLCLIIFSVRAHAQHSIDYLRDSTKLLPVNTIAKEVFQPLTDNFINFGQDSAYHWLRIHIQNTSAHHEKYFFEIAFPWLDSVYFYKQNFTCIKAMAWQTPFSERLYPHRNFVLPVLLKPHSDTTVYARFYKKRMLIKGEASVKNEDVFFSKRIFETSFYSFFTGIVAIVFIFAMAVF